MAKTIADIMSQNQQLNPNLGGVDDKKDKLEKLMRAKSGKATGAGTGPASSNIQELAATQQVADQQQQLNQAATMQQTQVQQQEAQLATQAKESATLGREEAKANKQQFERAKENIAQELQRNFKQLEMKDRESKFRAAATMARLGNEEYITKANTAAEKLRIKTQSDWESEYVRATHNDSVELLNNMLVNAEVLFAENQDFEEFLASVKIEDLDRAFEGQRADQDAESNKAFTEGFISIFTPGMG